MDRLHSARNMWQYDGEPAQPIHAAGEIEYRNWDITDKWAIDAKGHAWAQEGAHGGPLKPISASDLLQKAVFFDDRIAIAEALGVVVPKEEVDLHAKVQVQERLIGSYVTSFFKIADPFLERELLDEVTPESVVAAVVKLLGELDELKRKVEDAEHGMVALSFDVEKMQKLVALVADHRDDIVSGIRIVAMQYADQMDVALEFEKLAQDIEDALDDEDDDD